MTAQNMDKHMPLILNTFSRVLYSRIIYLIAIIICTADRLLEFLKQASVDGDQKN